MDGWRKFEAIEKKYLDREGVEQGNMMRSPALTFEGKVFCFYWEAHHAMCFKLGKEYPLEQHGVTSYHHLDPFNHKPPMTAWYVVSEIDQPAWDDLADAAFEKISNAG